MSESSEDQKIKCQSLWNFISKYTVTLTTSSEKDNSLEIYQQDVGSKIVSVVKIMRWKEKWKKQDMATLPTNAIDFLKACTADLF